MTVYTDEIEKNSNLFLETTLQSLFRKANLKLTSLQHSKEKGIDFTFEIETRDPIPETIEFISLQNKGSEKNILQLKNGLISYQLDDIRQVEYFCRQIDRPFIFTVCDLKAKTIYWTALQLEADYYLEKAEEIIKSLRTGKRKGKSIQIYLNPSQTLIKNDQLCNENFKDFLKQVEKSREFITQRASFKYSNERIDHIAVIEVDKSLHILDQLHFYLTKRFEFIKVLPHGFWALQYPFKSTKRSYFEYSLFTLFTDNPEVFNIFDSIEIRDNAHVQLIQPAFFAGVENIDEKIKFILRILNQNLVFNISLQDNQNKKSIRLVELDEDKESEYCFANLKFDVVMARLNSHPESENEIENLAFLQYEMGNYNQSARIYLELLGDVKNIQKTPKHFLYAYNLSKLESFVRYRYSNEKSDNELNKKLKIVKAHFENQGVLFAGDIRITKWIKERLYFWEFQSDLQENIEKLRDFYFHIANGGLGSNSLIWNIYVEHAMLISFRTTNRLVCDFQFEFDYLNNQVTESIFMSYGIHESISSRLEQFDDWQIKAMILYSKPENIQKYLSRYQIQTMKYARNSMGNDSFMDIARNFFGSAEAMTSNQGWEDSWKFADTYRNIMGNLLILSSYLELQDTEYLEIAKLLRRFLTYPLAVNYPLEVKFVNRFILNRSKVFDQSLFTDYFNLLFQSSKFHNEEFLYCLLQLSEAMGFKIELDSSSIEIILGFFEGECDMCSNTHDSTMLIYCYSIINSNIAKEKIKKKVIEKLELSFDWRLYYMSAMYEILPPEGDYFMKLIDFQNPTPDKSIFRHHYFKNQQNRNRRLGALLNLCFKFNIDLTNEKFGHFKGFDPYYDWLLDMNHFDYSLFNPRWITEYNTTYYLKRIAGIKQVRDKILSYLDKNHDPLVAKYFLILANNSN